MEGGNLGDLSDKILNRIWSIYWYSIKSFYVLWKDSLRLMWEKS